MFIIVSLGTLGAIAAMDNGKDTLLYAKFIADIGRWNNDPNIQISDLINII